MTISIIARCPQTHAFGIAIASSSPAVAARCAHVRGGVGVVASQNITDPRLGPRGLDLMAQGLTAPEALGRLRDETGDNAQYRQLMLVDRGGRIAGFSGAGTLGVHALAEGAGVVAGGNLLAGTGVPQAMRAAFDAADGPLPARLMTALAAGRDAGGEAGPMHSAGLLMVADVAWPVVDLRVDWAEDDPVAALAALWDRWAPEMQGYVTRALNPSGAPAFGVPGDP